jgi:hypothetical protein
MGLFQLNDNAGDNRDDDATQADFPDSSDEDDAVVEIQNVSVIPLPAASATAAVP